MGVPAATLALTNTSVPALRATQDRTVKSVSVGCSCWAATWQLILASFWWLVLDALYQMEENSISGVPRQDWLQRSSLSYSCFVNVWCLWTSASCSLGRSLQATLWLWLQGVPGVCWWGLHGRRLSASQEIPGSCRSTVQQEQWWCGGSRGGLWWHCCGLCHDVLVSLCSGARLPLRPLSQRGQLPRDIHGIWVSVCSWLGWTNLHWQWVLCSVY